MLHLTHTFIISFNFIITVQAFIIQLKKTEASNRQRKILGLPAFKTYASSMCYILHCSAFNQFMSMMDCFRFNISGKSHTVSRPYSSHLKRVGSVLMEGVSLDLIFCNSMVSVSIISYQKPIIV